MLENYRLPTINSLFANQFIKKKHKNLNGDYSMLVVVILPIFALRICFLFFLLNAARCSAVLKRFENPRGVAKNGDTRGRIL